MSFDLLEDDYNRHNGATADEESINSIVFDELLSDENQQQFEEGSVVDASSNDMTVEITTAHPYCDDWLDEPFPSSGVCTVKNMDDISMFDKNEHSSTPDKLSFGDDDDDDYDDDYGGEDDGDHGSLKSQDFDNIFDDEDCDEVENTDNDDHKFLADFIAANNIGNCVNNNAHEEEGVANIIQRATNLLQQKQQQDKIATTTSTSTKTGDKVDHHDLDDLTWMPYLMRKAVEGVNKEQSSKRRRHDSDDDDNNKISNCNSRGKDLDSPTETTTKIRKTKEERCKEEYQQLQEMYESSKSHQLPSLLQMTLEVMNEENIIKKLNRKRPDRKRKQPPATITTSGAIKQNITLVSPIFVNEI
mmetsp:Transcript_24132/g.33719  ORF Transcript_24132/g.33719 Transcript_24132/m.33719 type:complete len:359 (+) Transcript_24132:89-1165(+)